MLVKVCGLKDEKNINDVSNLDIDFMGLIFYRKSKRFIDKDFLVKKNNKKIVGVFVNETIDEIKSKIAEVGHDNGEYKALLETYEKLPNCCRYRHSGKH